MLGTATQYCLEHLGSLGDAYQPVVVGFARERGSQMRQGSPCVCFGDGEAFGEQIAVGVVIVRIALVRKAQPLQFGIVA